MIISPPPKIFLNIFLIFLNIEEIKRPPCNENSHTSSDSASVPRVLNI